MLMPQMTLDIRLDEQATFENYIVGDNAFLVDSLQSYKWLCQYRFLYLWGQASIGCSHLLQAICHHFQRTGWPIAYLPLKLCSEVSPDFLMGLEALKLVVIDDVETMSGIFDWEQALCRLYDNCGRMNTPLILSGHLEPNQIAWQLPDWSSRLMSALCLKIKPLSDTGKLSVLAARAEQRGLVIPQKVLSFMLTYYSRDMTVLLAYLDRLDEASLEQQRKLTIPFVKKVLTQDAHKEVVS